MADVIIKNARIYTADKEQPLASALVVRDGKFAYVGDEAGLEGFEGEITDLGGRFVMSGIVDSHVHVTSGVGFEYSDLGLRFEPDGKQEASTIWRRHYKLEHRGDQERGGEGSECGDAAAWNLHQPP